MLHRSGQTVRPRLPLRSAMKLRAALVALLAILSIALANPTLADDGLSSAPLPGNGRYWSVRNDDSNEQSQSVGDEGTAAPMPPDSASPSIFSRSNSSVSVASADGAGAPPNPMPPAAMQPGQMLPEPAPPGGYQPSGNTAAVQPPSSDISIGPPPGQPPEVFDGPPPARQHPLLDRFRRFFGPEPNGNWDNEPVHFDTFLGFIDDRTAQNTGVLGGFRLGWDYDTYWGIETRLGFTSLQEDTGPVVIWDESLLYYPWGDSRVRPYFTLGLGLQEFHEVETGDWHSRENLVDLPFGLGFKYRIHEWLALRFDVLDNLAFGSHNLGTMNNFSFTTGFEWRFGGSHYNYWPWNAASAR
jgi:hypothetical protein